MNEIRSLSSIRTSGRYALGAGVHNAITASLVEHTGFDILWLSSLELSTAKLLPDANLITFSEVANVLSEIKQATNIPIFVDADNGYGSDETAMRAAREFCSAGATAMCLEDNAFPKRNSFYAGINRHLEDSDTFCQRIKKVRRTVGSNMEIIARTEGLVAGLGIKETIERALAYRDAGADAIFVQTSNASLEDLAAVLSEIRSFTPLVTTPTTLSEVSATQLHALGVDVIIFSNVVIRTILQAVSQTLTELLRKQNLGAVNDRLATLENLFELTQAYHWLDASE